MASSSVLASTSTMLPFDAKSPVWADIVPVPQDDGPAPLCPILYSPNFSQAMDLLRALLPADELSPRSLALTEHLSKLCPSSYTVWHFRARILIHGPDSGPLSLGPKEERLKRELAYLDDLATTNMKNYQVWQHRKLIVTALGDPSRELEFVAHVLHADSKNYHTWVYRQWVLSFFGGLPRVASAEHGAAQDDESTASRSGDGSHHAKQYLELWDGELGYVDKMLEQDARNNSAWNHRYFCLFASRWVQNIQESKEAKRLCNESWAVGESAKQALEREVLYAKDHIKLVPNNASAWTYLRGVSRLLVETQAIDNPFSVAVDLATTLVPAQAEAEADPTIDQPPNTPPLALEWLLDDIDARLRVETKKSGAITQEEVAKLVADAELLVRRLCVADVIRRRFWSYRLNMIKRAALQHQIPA